MHILVPAALAVIAVLLFGFVIFFHELGHFLLAKAMGVKVNEFSLGMGPKLWGFARRDTQYSLRLLPIGGYCAMEGEEEDSGSQGSFSGKPVWKRILVVVAGGLFNVVLGFGLMVIVLSQQEVFATTTISQFAEGSALEQAGAQVGDTIKEIDGYAVLSERDLTFALALADPEAVSMEVEREGRRVDLGTFPLHTQTLEDGSQMVTLDFYVQPEEVTVLSVLRRGVTDTLSMARMVWETLAGMVTGRFGLNDLAGPIGTAQAITQAASAGLSQSFGQAVLNILTIMVMLTVNLGIVNLLPLPALDGGRLLFLVWEGITRRPVPQKYEGYVHAAGFVLLLGLMGVVAFNDIARLVTG